MEKFDFKSDKIIFHGCSTTSKACRVYNMKTLNMEESMQVKFDEFKEPEKDRIDE
jgi:hypothetical protein